MRHEATGCLEALFATLFVKAEQIAKGDGRAVPGETLQDFVRHGAGS